MSYFLRKCLTDPLGWVIKEMSGGDEADSEQQGESDERREEETRRGFEESQGAI